MKHIFVLFGATAVLSSCVDDLSFDAPKESKLDEIYFTASIAEQDFFGAKKAQTRSAADERQRVQAGFYDLAIDGRSDIRLSVSTLDGMFGKSVPMPEEGKIKATTRGVMLTELAQKPMTVIEYVKTSDGKSIVGEPYTAYTEDGFTWGGSHIPQYSNAVSRTLHAIYPSSESYTINAADKTVLYSTPFYASNQSDLLYASADQELSNQKKDSLNLTFNHLLTAVRFKIGKKQLPMSVINTIAIDGIATTGTFDFSSKTWTLGSGTNGVMCPLNFNVSGVENTIINGGENTFMLLPQQLTPNAKVTIFYEDYTGDDESTKGTKSLTATLATASTPAWVAGQCITYTLMDREADNEYILDVEAPEDFAADGGEQSVNVISYHQAGGIRTPMRWMVQSYSSDGGRTWMSGGATNVPAGMSISPTEGMSEDTIMSINVSLNAAKTMTNAPHREFLRYRTPLGYNGESFDLSRHDYLNAPCAQTTANCYVVDAPGKYRIPTAYGNAIVDGKTNKDAYTDKAGYKHSDGNNFMTHNGKAITAPMIRNNGVHISRATLVWEDVQNLINPDSIKLVDDGNAIEFEILADNIDQGNAVIAAMDGNTVVWSWHIWVTDEKATLAEPIEDQNKFGEQVDFMPLTLGWCSTANASGQIGREAAVRITMPDHLTSCASFRIRQNSTSASDFMENVEGNATYYNWGRKDPFPGAASTYFPVGSSNNAQDAPKPFYQAGTDAATLGLHAELHVEYGSDWKSLLAQGAIIGLDGFLTGVTIKNVMNYFKEVKNFEAQAGKLYNGYKLKAQSPTTRTLSGYMKTGTESYTANEVLDQVLNNTINNDYYAGYISRHVPTGTPVAYNMDKIGEGTLFLNEKGVPTHFMKISQPTNGKIGDFLFNIYAVDAQIPVAPAMCIGDFSGAIMTATHQMLSSTFDLGSVLSNSSLFTSSTDWCKEMTDHGVSINYGILNPNILMRDPISWVNHDGVGNLWNAGQIDYDEKNRPVVKSIYDPCPAGYCVPSARDMSNLNDTTTYTNYRGATAKISSNGKAIQFPGLGYRNFWSASEPGAAVNNNINDLIMFNGSQGMYWTSSPAINQDEDGEKGAYAINFRGEDSIDDYGEKKGVKYTPRVIKDLKLQQSYALPIRPVREK